MDFFSQQDKARRSSSVLVGLFVLAVVGLMDDKDRCGVLGPLIEQVSDWRVADIAGNARAATADQLAQDLRSLGAASSEFESVELALLSAVDEAGDYDRVLVMGSFFTVAQALEILQ